MNRIRTLDGIRGLAILLVVAGHIAANYQPLDPVWRQWLMAFANPSAGVRLFFVLSGYLITHLLLKEHAATGTVSLRGFYWRRGLRILPAFYVYLAVIALLSRWTPTGVSFQTGLAAGTFTWNYAFLWLAVPPEGVWDLGHLWTLALEQQFYLVWPMVILWLGPRRSLWIAIGMIVWCPLARVATYFLFPAQRGMLVMMFHTGLDSIMAGCAAALLLQSSARTAKLISHGARFAPLAAVWLLLLSPLTGEMLQGFPVVAGITLDALAAGWLIAWIHRAAPAGVGRVLGRGALPALGAISYSLYLWQQPFLAPAGPLGHGVVGWPLAGALGLALGSYWLIEKPALRLKATRPNLSAPAGP